MAGLESARTRGRKGGRPRLKSASGKVAMAKKLYRDRTLSIPEICKTLNISKATLYRWETLAGGMPRNRSHCMATILPIKWRLHMGVVKAPFYNLINERRKMKPSRLTNILKRILYPMRAFMGRFAITTREQLFYKAGAFVAADKIEGDYLQFRVFSGPTFASAFIESERIQKLVYALYLAYEQDWIERREL